MKVTTKTIMVLLVATMILSISPMGQFKASAYSASAAITYANEHWDDGVGLCAEFVSRCLNAGGVTIPNKSNYYSSSKLSYNSIGGTLGSYTNPYTCSEAQLVYFAEAGYRIISDPSNSGISPGDVVFMHGSNTGTNGRDDHVGICISNTDKVVYAAHNRATKTGTFSSSYPCTYVVKMDGASPVSAPTYATLSSNKVAYGIGESIVFSVLSDSATNYTIGINRYYPESGEYNRILTSTVSMPFTYNINNAGTYEAYVTAYNSAGYVDSNHIVFSVGLSPSEVTLTTNKNGYACNETVYFYAHSKNANGYTIGIDRLNESTNKYQRVLTQDINTEYSCVFSESGIYRAYVSAWSEAGLTDSDRIFFSVGQKPTDPVLQCNKNSYLTNQTISFSASANFADGYTVGIDKYNSSTNTYYRIYTHDVPANFTYTIKAVGQYRAYITAWNSVGTVDSSRIMFSIGLNVSDVSLSTDKVNYNVNESVLFTPSAKWANGYCLGINKYNPQTDSWDRIFTSDIGNSFEYTVIETGIYRAYVTAWNDLGTVDSQKIFFYVGNYRIIFNSNGGEFFDIVQTAPLGTDLILSSNLPIRKGYSFVAWNTKADGTGEEYLPNSRVSFLTDATLYAQWKKSFVLGDADGDGDIGLKDVVQITRYLAGGWDVTVDLVAADVNKDGEANLKDAVLLRRYLAGGWGVQLA